MMYPSEFLTMVNGKRYIFNSNFLRRSNCVPLTILRRRSKRGDLRKSSHRYSLLILKCFWLWAKSPEHSRHFDLLQCFGNFSFVHLVKLKYFNILYSYKLILIIDDPILLNKIFLLNINRLN